MEHPQRCIGSVILRRLSTVREAIGDKSIPAKGSKRFEETSRLAEPACIQQQSWQRNHSVSPPIREPGITCDDRFAVRGEPPAPVSYTHVHSLLWTRDDKLIASHN